MKIVIVSHNYPSEFRPNYGAFVYNFVQELSKIHDVHVIAPLRVNDLLKKKVSSYGNEQAKVYRPLFCPSLGKDGKVKRLINRFFYKQKISSIERCITAKVGTHIDALYCHFLVNGLSVHKFARKNRIPIVIASGESNDAYKAIERQNKKELADLIEYTGRFICVSTANVGYLSHLGVPERKISLVPNAVDYNRFKPLDKTQCKKNIGLTANTFVVGFIGHFIERKGPNRVIQALEMLRLEDTVLVCVGNNGTLIKTPYVKALPPMANSEIPSIMNSFDIFVLPTLSEGHCNVIEEIKAVGVPVISSLGTTVENQIDEKTGILIDPLNIQSIADAILLLKDNPKYREELRQNQLKLRGSNSLENRVRIISQLIEHITKKGVKL